MELSQYKTVEELAAAIKSLDMVTSVPWTDYSATSTIIGWSATTDEEIYYKKIGKLVFVQFFIQGTSDAATASFILPYSQQSAIPMTQVIRVKEDGTMQAGIAILPVSSITLSCYKNMAGNGFTDSGDKLVIGEFWYEAT